MTAVKNAKKFHLVSSLIITNSIETRMCSELTANPPQLTALTVEVDGFTTSHFLVALKALLAHTASTLKKLKFCHFPEPLHELPVFQNLKELMFKIGDNLWLQYVHKLAVVPHLSSNSFPKLKKIRLDAMEAEITRTTIMDHF